MMMKYQYTIVYKQQPENQFVFETLGDLYSTIIEEVHENVVFFFYCGVENKPRHATQEIVESELDQCGYAYLFSKSYGKGLTIRKRVVL